LIPIVALAFGPAGTSPRPKLTPAAAKPPAPQGPLISIAALPAWNSLSASTPVRPVGEICLFRIKSDQYFTAPTEFGESINAFFPSADTTSPPLPQSRIDHTGTANRSGNTTPYW